MNIIKHKANDLCIKFNIKIPSVSDLEKMLESLGFTIIEFNPFSNDENTSLLISALDLTRETSTHKAFTYHDSDYRLVFIQNHLSDTKKAVLLAHEIGHIECGHMGKNVIMGQGITDEWEANEFSHHLLSPDFSDKAVRTLKKHNGRIFMVTSMVVLAAVMFFAGYTIFGAQSGPYYVTPNGSKYHRKDCMYVKGRTDIVKISKKDMKSYSPCKVCLPDKQ